MINEKCAKLLKIVIQKKYKNVKLDKTFADANEFYYEFKIDDSISENDLSKLGKEIKELDKNVYVKLLRVSGVYFEGNANNEMITRIVGKGFESVEELNKYNKFLE